MTSDVWHHGYGTYCAAMCLEEDTAPSSSLSIIYRLASPPPIPAATLAISSHHLAVLRSCRLRVAYQCVPWTVYELTSHGAIECACSLVPCIAAWHCSRGAVDVRCSGRHRRWTGAWSLTNIRDRTIGSVSTCVHWPFLNHCKWWRVVYLPIDAVSLYCMLK